MKTDEQKLEKITHEFTLSILHNTFQDPKFYAELAGRLAVLIDLEIKQNLKTQKDSELMSLWPLEMRN